MSMGICTLQRTRNPEFFMYACGLKVVCCDVYHALICCIDQLQGPDLIVHQPDTVLDGMDSWCTQHHGKVSRQGQILA